MALTVNTVANNTAAGTTWNMVSGIPNTYDSATAPFPIPRLMYLSRLSVRSMTITSTGKPSSVIRNTRSHARRT